MMTKKEEASEFWMLTKGILQDSRVDTTEAQVIKRWLEEHQHGEEYSRLIQKLERFFQDGYIDRFESQELIESIGTVLRTLRASGDQA